MSAFAFSIAPFGENGWLASLTGGDSIDRAVAANAAADALRKITGVTDAVAGVESLVLRFTPADLSAEAARLKLEAALKNTKPRHTQHSPTIEIPVCYGGAHGPDFNMLCGKLRISGDELVALHSGVTYRVLTIGFAPGFAYLGPLPEKLQTARLATPRQRVPAGSVGVAGTMTGVYALSSPGGWPLIGRTPKTLFNTRAEHPFLFSPGAQVRFVPIAEHDFARNEASRQ